MTASLLRLARPQRLRLARPASVFAAKPIARQFSSSPALASGIRELLSVSEEVTEAVATNKPVVALESTIYTHGILGNDLAKQHLDLVRSHGGIPAIIAIVDGRPKVGVSYEEILRMIEDKGTVKASRRDMSYLVGMVSWARHPTSEQCQLTMATGPQWSQGSWWHHYCWHHAARQSRWHPRIRHWWARWRSSRRRKLHGRFCRPDRTWPNQSRCHR